MSRDQLDETKEYVIEEYRVLCNECQEVLKKRDNITTIIIGAALTVLAFLKQSNVEESSMFLFPILLIVFAFIFYYGKTKIYLKADTYIQYFYCTEYPEFKWFIRKVYFNISLKDKLLEVPWEKKGFSFLDRPIEMVLYTIFIGCSLLYLYEIYNDTGAIMFDKCIGFFIVIVLFISLVGLTKESIYYGKNLDKLIEKWKTHEEKVNSRIERISK